MWPHYGWKTVEPSPIRGRNGQKPASLYSRPGICITSQVDRISEIPAKRLDQLSIHTLKIPRPQETEQKRQNELAKERNIRAKETRRNGHIRPCEAQAKEQPEAPRQPLRKREPEQRPRPLPPPQPFAPSPPLRDTSSEKDMHPLKDAYQPQYGRTERFSCQRKKRPKTKCT